jgi:hypothetical protein
MTLMSATTQSEALSDQNLLINGSFRFWQRQVPTTLTAVAGDTYGADRWYVLTNGGATDIQTARVDGIIQYAGQLKQVNASAKYMGYAQIVEGFNSMPMRGQRARLQVNLTASTNTNVRIAILEWTGTVNAVTSDVVKSWASTTYTANNFFLTSNLNVTAVSPTIAVTTGHTEVSLEADISPLCNNLIVFYWTESAVAQNVTLTAERVGLYMGGGNREWIPRSMAEELLLCKRYYQKSYAVDVAPGSVSPIMSIILKTPIANGAWYYSYSFPVEMLKTPTSLVFLSGNGTAGRASNYAGVDYNANSAFTNTFNSLGFGVYNNSGVDMNIGINMLYIGYTAEAEL